ncbi:MAG: nucleotide pyrophosphohydrolase [Anaerosporomusa subterranea]|jgi:NTP pyrophosphatase (non-canonical NTP hydrolase)|nr:nucleotide pyrophosphohydrolase [Anaerosporomusa subterranea]MDF2572304.1 nucleotide pyrophosphohydrolase [Sporomusa sp.]
MAKKQCPNCGITWLELSVPVEGQKTSCMCEKTFVFKNGNWSEGFPYFEEYQRLAERTANNGQGAMQRLGNFGMGIAGETAEFIDAVVNFETSGEQHAALIKEAGDVSWYCATLCTTAGISYQVVVEAAEEAEPALLYVCIGRLSKAAGDVTEYLKKVVYHGHELDQAKLGNLIGTVLSWMKLFCKRYNLNMQDICDTNIAKLKQRYPEGFNSAGSINRIV